MKRLILALIVWLAFVTPCAASLVAPNRGAITSHACGSATSCTATVPTSAVNGHPLIECVFLSTNAAINSFGTGGTNAFTTLDSTTNTVRGACAYKNVVTGDPATYTVTWTGAATSTVVYVDVGLNTDGTTPALDVHAITTGIQAASITTTVAGDEVLNIVMNTAIQAGNTGAYAAITASDTSAGYTVLASGQETAGTPPAVSWVPTNGNPPITETVAFKANTTTAEMFVGVGAEAFNSGSASNVNPLTPANVNVGDIGFAGIMQSGTNAVSVTDLATWTSNSSTVWNLASLIIACGGSACTNRASSGVGSATVTVPASTYVVGDLMTIYVRFGNTVNPTLTGWNSLCTYTTNNHAAVFTRTADSTDAAGTTYTIGGAGTFPAYLLTGWVGGAGTPTVDQSSCTVVAASTSTTTPVTNLCSVANCRIWNTADQNSGSVVTVPTNDTALTSASTNIQHGYRNSTVSTWTLVASKTNEASTVTQAVYRHQFAANDPSYVFQFASNPSVSNGVIAAFGNINTTTPTDNNNSISNEGLNQAQQAPLIQPTSTDELALTFNGYSACSPSAPLAGQYPSPIQSNPTGNSRISAYYTTVDAAMAAQAVDQCGGPYVSTTMGLNAATAPTTTSANLRIQQQIEEIFALAPAPSLSNGAWFF